MATVILLGTLDTKGVEYDYVMQRVRAAGCDVILIDSGVLDIPLITPDISREDIAQAAGETVAALAATGDRARATDIMARGATITVRRLYEEGQIHGILGLGGSGGTSLITRVMQGLPVGVPKLMVSTVASGDTRTYVGAVDITMMYSVVDIAGLNRVSERILTNAAAAIAGMARAYADFEPAYGNKPVIATTMFGVTTPCVTAARQRLESLGYEVLVFHATGTGGQSMEALINDGRVSGVLDVTTTELADELVGGVMSAGPLRLEAAGARGIPQVVSLGALHVVNFGPRETIPERFNGRDFIQANPAVTLMRTTPEESQQLGQIIAHKLNKATGPVSVFIPLQGAAMGATADESFQALVHQLKADLQPNIEVQELDMHINDERFAQAMADWLDAHLRQSR